MKNDGRKNQTWNWKCWFFQGNGEIWNGGLFISPFPLERRIFPENIISKKMRRRQKRKSSIQRGKDLVNLRMDKCGKQGRRRDLFGLMRGERCSTARVICLIEKDTVRGWYNPYIFYNNYNNSRLIFFFFLPLSLIRGRLFLYILYSLIAI